MLCTTSIGSWFGWEHLKKCDKSRLFVRLVLSGVKKH